MMSMLILTPVVAADHSSIRWLAAIDITA